MAIEGLEDVIKADSAKSTKIDCNETTEEYVNKSDWRLSANANGSYSHAQLINNSAGKIIANYWLDKVYSKQEGDAHRNGDYHIHDLDNLSGYCCGHDLMKLLNEGFNGVAGRVGSKPPKHVREALNQMANYIGILQAEWAGAQAFSSFDTYLAPLVFFDRFNGNLNFDELKKGIKNFVYNLNVPSRWGQCVPAGYKALRADGMWASYKDLKAGDRIFVFDRETGSLKTDTLKAVNVYPAPEKMHKYTSEENPMHSFMVTPNHKVVVREDDGTFSLRESAEILAAGKPARIPLGAANVLENFANEGLDPLDIDDARLELYAVAMLMGYLDREGRVCIAVKRGGEVDALLDDIAMRLGEHFERGGFENRDYAREGCDCEVILSKALTDGINGMWQAPREDSSVFWSHDRMREFANRLSFAQATHFFNTAVRLCAHYDSGLEGWFFAVPHAGHAHDPLALLAMKFGSSLHFSMTSMGDDTVREGFMSFAEDSMACTVEEVCAADAGLSEVWCPTTDTGTFVACPDSTNIYSAPFITGNSPFSNVTIDLKCPKDLLERNPMRNNNPFLVDIYNEYRDSLEKGEGLLEKYANASLLDIPEEDMRALERVRGWKRLMAECSRRLGKEGLDDETICYSMTYKHFDEEMKMVMRAYYEVMSEGDEAGLPFTFPIPTVNITEDFDWDNPAYDILWDNTAKYGCSYFQNFVGSQYLRDENGQLTIKNPDAYSPDDVRSMAFSADTRFKCRMDGVEARMTAAEMFDAYTLGLKLECLSEKHEWNNVSEVFSIDYSDGRPFVHIVLQTPDESLKLPSMTVSMDHKCAVYSKDGKIVEKMSQDVCEGDEMPYYDKKARALSCARVVGSFTVPARDKRVYNFTIATPEHLVELDNGIVSFQCCRLQLDKKEVKKRGGGLFGSDSQTGCYDDQTEVLTTGGWKFFKDLTMEDEFFTRTTGDIVEHGKVEVHKAANIFEYDYDGDMYSYESGNVSLLVTPNHNMMVLDANGRVEITRADLHDGEDIDVLVCSSVHDSGVAETVRNTHAQYTGKVYCVEVPNHTLFVRRNGKTCWCGNSIGVVTINLARLGYCYKGDEKGYMKRLFKLMDHAKSTIEKKRKFIKEMVLRGLYPYTRRYINSAKDGFTTFFSTIGVNGMNESIRNFTDDEHDITDEFGQRFALKVCKAIRERLAVYQEETGNLYNFEATPGEGTTYRFAREDLKRFGSRSKFYVHCHEHGIQEVPEGEGDTAKCPVCGEALPKARGIIQAGFEDMPYYTNSTQLPANYGEDVFSALDLQDDLQCSYNGGCVEKGNYVVTNRGNMLIEDIVNGFDKEGDLKVASFNPQTNTLEWDRVVDAMSIDVSQKDKVRVVGERGFEIVTSDWHPFFVVVNNYTVKEVRADELKPGDVLLGACDLQDGVPAYRLEHTKVLETSKVDVGDNQFYDLTTEKNHNYLCGKKNFVFIHNTVFHIYSSENISGEQVKTLMKKVLKTHRMPYISFTASFSICPKHGRIPGLHDYCPLCDKELLAKHAEEYDPAIK